MLLALVALLFVRFAMCSLPVSFKNSLWLDSRAVFASEPRLQKRLSAQQLQFCECRLRSAIFFLPFMLYNAFSFKLLSLFCKTCSPPTVRSTFLKNSCKQSALINLRFGSLLGAFSAWVPLRRARIRQYQCYSHPCHGHFSH